MAPATGEGYLKRSSFLPSAQAILPGHSL